MIYTQLKFSNVGNGTIVCATRILTVIRTGTNPGQRILRKSKKEGKFIDACMGRACKSLIITDVDTVIGTIYKPETIMKKLEGVDDNLVEMDEPGEFDELMKLGSDDEDEEEEDD